MEIVILLIVVLAALALFGAAPRRPEVQAGRDSIYQEQLSQASADRPSFC